MGLGLFIAKTLLERSGAEMSFANGRDAGRAAMNGVSRVGAIVEAEWQRERMGATADADRLPLGENVPLLS